MVRIIWKLQFLHKTSYRNKYQIVDQERCAVCNRFCQVAIAAKNSHKPIFDRKFLYWCPSMIIAVWPSEDSHDGWKIRSYPARANRIMLLVYQPVKCYQNKDLQSVHFLDSVG